MKQRRKLFWTNRITSDLQEWNEKRHPSSTNNIMIYSKFHETLSGDSTASVEKLLHLQLVRLNLIDRVWVK